MSQREEKEEFRSLYYFQHYFAEPFHGKLPGIPFLPSPRICGRTDQCLTLAMALHNMRSMNCQSLQQAEEFPVVLITFSFGHQAVQLIDQLGFHLQEK